MIILTSKELGQDFVGVFSYQRYFIYCIWFTPGLPDFNLGAASGNCWPLSQSESEVRSAEWVVYPNPSSTVFIVQNKQGKKKELYNVQGELLFLQKKMSLT
ncbi:MAG: T9SS type A sorting domain-containing protein [Bacteroidota bacterium]|nr:MAG: T9SS type A sorting domain-containing protein [Bacteroidota bacterium]